MRTLADDIPGWPEYAGKGYSIKRVDDQIWCVYPETIRDGNGEWRRIIRKYPIEQFRNDPQMVIRDIRAHEAYKASRRREAPWFVRM